MSPNKMEMKPTHAGSASQVRCPFHQESEFTWVNWPFKSKLIIQHRTNDISGFFHTTGWILRSSLMNQWAHLFQHFWPINKVTYKELKTHEEHSGLIQSKLSWYFHTIKVKFPTSEMWNQFKPLWVRAGSDWWPWMAPFSHFTLFTVLPLHHQKPWFQLKMRLHFDIESKVEAFSEATERSRTPGVKQCVTARV